MAEPVNAMMGATISTDVAELRDTFAKLAEAFQHIADGYRKAEAALTDQPDPTVSHTKKRINP